MISKSKYICLILYYKLFHFIIWVLRIQILCTIGLLLLIIAVELLLDIIKLNQGLKKFINIWRLITFMVKWSNVLIYDPECIRYILKLDCFLCILRVYYISQLHFGLFVFLQIIAHYHAHHCEYYIDVQLIFLFNKQLVNYELRGRVRQKGRC